VLEVHDHFAIVAGKSRHVLQCDVVESRIQARGAVCAASKTAGVGQEAVVDSPGSRLPEVSESRAPC